MYTSRICPACQNNRFPDEKVVSEKRQKYVIYECRICHHKDIERIHSVRKPLWDPKWGKFSESTDETGIEEEPGP